MVVVSLALTFALPAKATQSDILDELPKADASALRLVMVAFPGCPFCLRWEQQVGIDYNKDPLGKTAPLVRVLFGAPSLSKFANIKYTPTFLLLRGNVEVGRIAGYPGRDAFWDEFKLLLEKAGPADAPQL